MNKPMLIKIAIFSVLLSGCVITDRYEKMKQKESYHTARYEKVKQEELYYTGKSIELYLYSRDTSPNRFIAIPNNNSIYVWSIDKSYNDEIKCNESLQGELSCSGLGYVAQSCEISVFTNADNIITNFKYSKDCRF